MLRLAKALPFAAGVLAAWAAPALAHGGDHAHMSFSELMTHLSASLDHKVTIGIIGLVLALAASSVLVIGKKRLR